MSIGNLPPLEEIVGYVAPWEGNVRERVREYAQYLEKCGIAPRPDILRGFEPTAYHLEKVLHMMDQVYAELGINSESTIDQALAHIRQMKLDAEGKTV